jgi:hypothetical protein
VVLGAANTTTTKTKITSSGTDTTEAFEIVNTGSTDGQMGGLKVFANAPGAFGMLGVSTASTAAGIGVWGEGGSPSGFGVVGANLAGGTAIQGGGEGAGSIGVEGFGDIGVSAAGTTFGLLAQGTTAAIRLVLGGSVGAPSTGMHAAGELLADSNGDLYFCTQPGTPGIWTKLNNQAGPGGGPQLVNPPQRVYDSRPGQTDLSPSPQGTLSFGSTRTIDCSASASASAVAILFNLTCTGTVGSHGALAITATGAPAPTTSNVNWTSPGTTIANMALSACNGAQQVNVKCVASAGCSTNFILDVFAYYT